MTDVFLTTCATPADPIRWHLFQAVKSRWQLEPDIRLHIVSNEVENCEPRSFDGWRRRVAEDNATSEIYLCCDDDCMPIGSQFVNRGIAQMGTATAQQFAVLGALLFGTDLLPSGYELLTLQLARGSTAGGVNFVRRGLLTDVLPKTKDAPMFDESSLGNAVRGINKQVGYMLRVRVNHLGAHLSTLWPEPFTAMTQIA